MPRRGVVRLLGGWGRPQPEPQASACAIDRQVWAHRIHQHVMAGWRTSLGGGEDPQPQASACAIDRQGGPSRFEVGEAMIASQTASGMVTQA